MIGLGDKISSVLLPSKSASRPAIRAWMSENQGMGRDDFSMEETIRVMGQDLSEEFILVSFPYDPELADELSELTKNPDAFPDWKGGEFANMDDYRDWISSGESPVARGYISIREEYLDTEDPECPGQDIWTILHASGKFWIDGKAVYTESEEAALIVISILKSKFSDEDLKKFTETNEENKSPYDNEFFRRLLEQLTYPNRQSIPSYPSYPSYPSVPTLKDTLKDKNWSWNVTS